METDDSPPWALAADPDSHQRRIHIRRFLLDNHLSSAEVRYAKILLSSFAADPISELPIELLAVIASYLDSHEIAACLAVSKTWRGRFLSGSVTRSFRRSQWPCLWEDGIDQARFITLLQQVNRAWSRLPRCHFQRRSPLELDSLKFDLNELGPQGLRHRTRRYPAHPALGTVPATQESLELPMTALYSHGKVAFPVPRRSHVVLEHLSSKEQQTFSVPNGLLAGSEFELRALGSRLIVGNLNNTLVAWDLVTREYQEKRLPSSIQACATAGSKVIAILFNGEVLFWDFGGKLREIPLAPLTDGLFPKNERALDAWRARLRVFVNFREDMFYLASGCVCSAEGEPPSVKHTVHEFKDTTCVGAYVHESSEFVPLCPFPESASNVSILINHRSVARGLVTFAGLHNPRHCHHHKAAVHTMSPRYCFHHVVSFDTDDKTWQVPERRGSEGLDRLWFHSSVFVFDVNYAVFFYDDYYDYYDFTTPLLPQR
ncbi:hypothetical protein F4780DRAFT_371992 [Xylariomycetidae sp. FL0641]|nr:hypothetical protein F4780DRAFT_371992 [Xylariomycetidae sp. FL0641]